MDLTSLIDYKFNINESYLVIGDYSYRDIFLSLKKKNPFLKIKYYSFNELSSFLEYKVDDKIISYIIHNYNDTIDYLKAKELATILINVNENDNKDDNIYKKLKLEMINKGIITKDMIRDGQVIVLDAGISRTKNTICGDVCFEEVAEKALVTPVPGGIGRLTTAVVALHTAQAARCQYYHKKKG